MQISLKIALLSMCLGVALAGTPLSMSARTDMGLMKLMMDTREANQGNPGRSLECFDYYVPVLNGITEQYQINYKACLTKADQSFAAIDTMHVDKRTAFQETSEAACKLLSECSDKSDSLSSFACYSEAGSANSRTMFTLSADASELHTIVMEEYRLVENEQFRCTNETERIYVEDTANAYTELNRCLSGASPVPTTTTASPAPSSTPEDTTPQTTINNEVFASEGTFEPIALRERRRANIVRRLGQYI